MTLIPATHAAEIAPERFTFQDSGQKRTFAVVSDQIAIRGVNGRMRHQTLAPVADTAGIQRQARALTTAAGERVELILTEIVDGSASPTLRYVRPQIVVEAASADDARAAANIAGLVYVRAFGGRHHILAASRSADVLDAVTVLANQPGIRSATPMLARQQGKRLIPDDPLFNRQWHLLNTGQSSGTAGIDANIVSVWDSHRGAGVTIGIVDDGVETTHPDLIDNVNDTIDHDWNDETPDDPNPDVDFDFHGTACAGVAAARGNNTLGVSGAAPEATIVGLRLIAGPSSDLDEAEAMGWENNLIPIKSNSWGPIDTGRLLAGPDVLTAAALAAATETGRDGLGTIILWAGGNGRDNGDNSNYDGYANSIYTIAVGALTNDGEQSYYSESGANLAISAPSNGGSDPGITTTDLSGNDGYNYSGASGNLSDRSYTNNFGGTSSATPLAAGVVALLLESKPSLGWRDVKEILMQSATMVSPTDTDWVVNAAGFHFNHKFGAGLINAADAVSLAQDWVNLPPATSRTLERSALDIPIPDGNNTGTSISFDLTDQSNLRVEHVTIKVDIAHESRGQLAITLTSPQGTASRLAEKHADTGEDYAEWTFMTVRSWGEAAQGVWTLKVADLTGGTSGIVTSATLTVHGTPAPDLNRRPVIAAANIAPASELFADADLSVSGIEVSDHESDPITLAYQWQTSVDNQTFADIQDATSATLPGDASRAGIAVRCRVTPADAEGEGLAFFTESRPLNRRPVLVAITGTDYAYDSELFVPVRPVTFSKPAIINEFSQGANGNKDWVEILFLGDVTDARGWTLVDRGSGSITFSQHSQWSAVPAGTLLVVYNGSDKDPTLRSSDQTIINASRTLTIAHSNGNYFRGSWPLLNNNAAEYLTLNYADESLIDGICYGGEESQLPILVAVGNQKSAAYQGGSDADSDLDTNWLVQGVTAPPVTPAAGNNEENKLFISKLRAGTLIHPSVFSFGAASQTPEGLVIDPATGILSGTLTATPGVYTIIIERTNGADIANQTVQLLVTAADGSATIPAGTSWSLNSATTLPGSLTIEGTLDTAGQSLTVLGTITLNGGTVLNASPGSIYYGDLVGGVLPGFSASLSSLDGYETWIATYPALTGDDALRASDPDRDGQTNLLEHALDTDPTSAESFTSPSPHIVANRLRLTFPRAAQPLLVYTVEASSDLVTWTAIWTSTGGGNVAGSVTVDDDQDLPADGRRFLRLVVSEL